MADQTNKAFRAFLKWAREHKDASKPKVAQ